MMSWVIIALIAPVFLSAQSEVEKHGQLRVEGNRVLDQHGQQVSFAGMSLFWSQWGGQYYNPAVIKTLVDEWKCGVIRAAMAIEMGGYLTDPDREKAKIKTAVESCIAEGIYVIIDWHDHHAHQHQEQAISFFTEMAREYGKYPNVIYEIYNEPERISWKDLVKPYSEAVIAAIRNIDPDNLIIVGTTSWSQDLDVAAKDPIKGFDNLVYSLHFYAASHKDEYMRKAQTGLDKGIAIFASEWGCCEYTGDGFIDEVSTAKWTDFMKKNGISWCNWSLNDRKESASALKPGTKPDDKWTEDDLTPSGKLIRKYIIEWTGNK